MLILVMALVTLVSPATSSEGFGNGLEPIGCYANDAKWSFYDMRLRNIHNNTLETCAGRCSNFGYKYSAAGGIHCACTSSEPPARQRVLASSRCRSPCPGNKNQTCGNAHGTAMSVHLDESFKPSCFNNELYGGEHPLATVRALGPKDCQQQCKEARRAGCFFFSFIHDSGKCLLFKEHVWRHKRVATNDTVTSGAFSCDMCYELGVFYHENGVRRVSSSSVFECQKKCQQTPTCHYFSQQLTSNLCYLHNENATGAINLYHRRDEAVYLFISGPRSCVGCYKSGQSIVSLDSDDDDFLIRPHEDVATAIRCQMLCVKETGCTHFNYHKISGRCDLVRSKGHSEPDPNVVSGPSACDTCPCQDPDWHLRELSRH